MARDADLNVIGYTLRPLYDYPFEFAAAILDPKSVPLEKVACLLANVSKALGASKQLEGMLQTTKEIGKTLGAGGKLIGKAAEERIVKPRLVQHVLAVAQTTASATQLLLFSNSLGITPRIIERGIHFVGDQVAILAEAHFKECSVYVAKISTKTISDVALIVVFLDLSLSSLYLFGRDRKQFSLIEIIPAALKLTLIVTGYLYPLSDKMRLILGLVAAYYDVVIPFYNARTKNEKLKNVNITLKNLENERKAKGALERQIEQSRRDHTTEMGRKKGEIENLQTRLRTVLNAGTDQEGLGRAIAELEDFKQKFQDATELVASKEATVESLEESNRELQDTIHQLLAEIERIRGHSHEEEEDFLAGSGNGSVLTNSFRQSYEGDSDGYELTSPPPRILSPPLAYTPEKWANDLAAFGRGVVMANRSVIGTKEGLEAANRIVRSGKLTEKFGAAGIATLIRLFQDATEVEELDPSLESVDKTPNSKSIVVSAYHYLMSKGFTAFSDPNQ